VIGAATSITGAGAGLQPRGGAEVDLERRLGVGRVGEPLREAGEAGQLGVEADAVAQPRQARAQRAHLLGVLGLEEQPVDVAEVEDPRVVVGRVAEVHRHVGPAGAHDAEAAGEADAVVAAQDRRMPRSGAARVAQQRVGDAPGERPHLAVAELPLALHHADAVGIDEGAALEEIADGHRVLSGRWASQAPSLPPGLQGLR
jgi:hypothetical protein